MKTVEIILQLINSIQKNPSSLYQMPWEDLKLCFITELDYRRELYPDTQFQFLLKLFQNHFSELDNCLAIPDISAVIHILKEFAFALQMLPDAEYTDISIQKANYNEARLNHYANDTIIVLGDSHVNFFSGNEMISYTPVGNDINICPTINDNPFTVLHLGPCLAYNCNKTDTFTLFREKVEYLCNNFMKPNCHIICCLGEIDLRVHVFRQVELQCRTYQEIVDDILAEYVTFLSMLQEKGYRVYCWGPIASQPESCPIDPDFPRTGTETERNTATAYFNEQLSAQCKQHNIGYLSIYEQMITDDFETIEEYLSADHCHLSQRALTLAEPVWQKKLPL